MKMLESIRRRLPKILKSFDIFANRKEKALCVCLVTCTLPCVRDSDVCTENLGDGLALFSGCIFVRHSPLFWWARGG